MKKEKGDKKRHYTHSVTHAYEEFQGFPEFAQLPRRRAPSSSVGCGGPANPHSARARGGVGGLTNQFGCRNASEASADDGAEAPYCFQPGWLGFTVFGGTMLLLWTEMMRALLSL